LALAAILLFLRSFYDYEGNGFAEGAAFGDSYSLAFFHVEAWWIVSVDVAVAAFISFELRDVELVVSSYHNGFVHFSAYDNAVENSSSY